VARCLREGQILGLAEHTVLVNRRAGDRHPGFGGPHPRPRRQSDRRGSWVFHDISKERRLHRALHYQASHDALTGLINRREFENRFDRLRSRRRGRTRPRARAAVFGFGSIQAGQRHLRGIRRAICS